MAHPTPRDVCRAILVGVASLFSFGEPERHFAEPPAILQPVVEDKTLGENGEPDEDLTM